MNILAFTQLDAVILLVAALIGLYGGYHPEGPWYGRSAAWGLVALWALLKLIRAI